jgi:hypothetical protein
MAAPGAKRTLNLQDVCHKYPKAGSRPELLGEMSLNRCLGP